MYLAKKERYEKMEYRACGRSGLRLPVLSLGLWHNFGTWDSYETMKEMCTTAFDHGITYFDLANNYGPKPGSAEKNFGHILKEELSDYRDELIISTKAGYTMWEGPYGDGGSRKYLIASIDQSLKRMGIDYVDIFYHHRMDAQTPLEETMEALVQIVRSGKALYVGLSNYDGPHLEEAVHYLKEARCPFVVNQNSYNLFNRTIEKNGLAEASKREGVGVVAYSPLAQGLLTNRYLGGVPSDSRIGKNDPFLKTTDLTEKRLDQIGALQMLAQERGQSLAQMALSWILQHDFMSSVIIGASCAEQIIDNLGAVEAAPFTADELEKIEAICSED